MHDVTIAQIEGLLLSGEISTAEEMARNLKVSSTVREIIGQAIFEASLKRDVLIKKNSPVTREAAIAAFHRLFKK